MNGADATEFTLYCRAFEKPVTIVRLPSLLPFCKETCTSGGICDNRPCWWSVANAVSAKASAEVSAGKSYLWEEWMSNILSAGFPFFVDYTETAWDPCSVPVACPDGCKNFLISIAGNKDMEEFDCTMPRDLHATCLHDTLTSGNLVFAILGIGGYDNDPRDLHEIPEVIRWVQFCESQIPDIGAWLHPDSMVWFAGVAFKSLEKDHDIRKKGIPIKFYREWTKANIAAASRVLENTGASKALIQRLTTSMWHKAGWALHGGWGAWFRDVPYRQDLALDLWQQHKPLTAVENIDYNLALRDRIRKQALSNK